MINNPELIKKIIDQIQNVLLNILDEAIKEVEEENLYIELIKQYKNEIKDKDIKPVFILDLALNIINKQKKQLETIKEYVHQEIVHYTEDIRDYIDDDKEGNKYIVGELKEEREHWKDIERILQNKSKEELYMDWWRYGLYE